LLHLKVLQSYVHSKTHPHTLQSIAPVTNRIASYMSVSIGL